MLKYLAIQDIIIMLLGCAVLAFWLFIFLKSKKNYSFFDSLDEGEYPLKELYGMGFTVMEMISYNYKGKFDRKLRSQLSILYEEKYVEYYIRVVYAQSITIGMLMFVLSFVAYGLVKEIVVFLMLILVSFTLVYYYMTLAQTRIQKRSDELLSDFSDIVSKLALLVNAGMIMHEAWNEVAYAGDSTIYLEMQKSCEDMSNGVSEAEAIRRFGVRCVIPEIKKFSGTIIQGIEKGNKELAIMLRTQSDEVWALKKQIVLRAGAKANSKLLIPMMIMFLGILIMIVVPIFTNLGIS